MVLLGAMGAGGSEQQVLQLLRRIDRRRFQPHLYLIARRGEWLDQIPSDVPVASYWPDHSSPGLYLPGRILWDQARHVRRTLNQWKIDCIYDRTSQMTLTAFLAGRDPPVTRVSVAAGDPRREFYTAHRRFSLVKYWLVQRAYRDADRIIAVSHAVRDGLVSFYGLAPHRICTLYPIVDSAEVRNKASHFVPPRESGNYYLVSVGRLQQEKGQQFLLQAIAHLVHRGNDLPLRVWIIGSGPDEVLLKKLAANLRLENVVEFLGYQSNPLPWVQHADVFCLSSLYEGLPNAVVEAMLCGTPVIATECPGGVSELLGDGARGRLVPPGDAQALAQVIADTLHNLSSARQCAIVAQQWAQTQFDADSLMQRLEDLLEELPQRRRASHPRA